MQLNLTGFLNGRNARSFMGELWDLLVSAQESVTGIPETFLQQKKDQIKKRLVIISFHFYNDWNLKDLYMINTYCMIIVKCDSDNDIICNFHLLNIQEICRTFTWQIFLQYLFFYTIFIIYDLITIFSTYVIIKVLVLCTSLPLATLISITWSFLEMHEQLNCYILTFNEMFSWI